MKFIDLGLPSGTLWADRNLGAKRQHDAGVYISNPQSLHLEDATLPSDEQVKELLSCPKKWTIRNEKPGYLIKGFNGNSIFLPAVGSYTGTSLGLNSIRGLYWLASYYDSSYAYFLNFSNRNIGTNTCCKCHGMSIRLVKSK